jgi:DTW domain-containing protein YfiP
MCADLPRLRTRAEVVLVIHHIEDRKSTNTGRLALACLASGRVVVRGDRSAAPSALVPEGTEPLVLFPHDDAEPLTPRAPDAPPVTLVVPDGSWRQAWKVRGRTPELAGARAVTLPPGPPSRYRLRAEAHPNALSTVEAVARALGILEGPDVQASLERAFDAFVERTLWVRGELDDEEVASGLPPRAQRHDPLSGLDPLVRASEAAVAPRLGRGARVSR